MLRSAKITGVAKFSSAHSINEAGKCANKHGHNWVAKIEVGFYGTLNKQGFVADVAEIKKAATKYDHDDLDNYFEWPSTENVAQKIADDVAYICLQGGAVGDFDIHVHVIETENNSADAWQHTSNIGD